MRRDAAKKASDPDTYEAESALSVEFVTTALIAELRRRGRMKYHEHLVDEENPAVRHKVRHAIA